MLKFFLNIVVILLLSCTANTVENDSLTLANPIDESIFFAKINYTYHGCFGGGKKQILIKSNKDSYFAILKNEDGKVYNARLNKYQMDTFDIFINDLRKLKDAAGLCTTSQQYEVKYGIETIVRAEGDCQWWGFKELEKCFFNLPY